MWNKALEKDVFSPQFSAGHTSLAFLSYRMNRPLQSQMNTEPFPEILISNI